MEEITRNAVRRCRERKMLDIAADFAQESGIVFGEDKSQVMFFNNAEKANDVI